MKINSLNLEGDHYEHYDADIARAAQREYARQYRQTHREQMRNAQRRYWYRKGLAMNGGDAVTQETGNNGV